MTSLATLVRAQSKVVLREPVAAVFGLVFPAVLLLVIGNVFPGATAASVELGGRSLVEVYAPATIVLGLLTMALTVLPASIGTDRERGILRRLSTTPAHPRTLVTANLVVQSAAVTVASVAAVVTGVVAFDLALPVSLGWFALSYLLAAGTLLALGLLIGALVPTTAAGTGVGMLAYFPMLFFAGIYLPLEVMPAGIRTLSGWTPAGAAVQALGDAWAGTTPEPTALLVMLGWTVITGATTVRSFRWD